MRESSARSLSLPPSLVQTLDAGQVVCSTNTGRGSGRKAGEENAARRTPAAGERGRAGRCEIKCQKARPWYKSYGARLLFRLISMCAVHGCDDNVYTAIDRGQTLVCMCAAIYGSDAVVDAVINGGTSGRTDTCRAGSVRSVLLRPGPRARAAGLS